jgi:FAD/FMN-containing dehydrogenase
LLDLPYLQGEEVGKRIQAAYGANFSRLAKLKAQLDPQNLFRMNKNSAPAN